MPDLSGHCGRPPTSSATAPTDRCPARDLSGAGDGRCGLSRASNVYVLTMRRSASGPAQSVAKLEGRMSFSGQYAVRPPAHSLAQQAAALVRRVRMRAKGWSDDRATTKVLQRHLRPDSICVDVGAHTGKILGRMQRFAPAASHYAFAPLPHLAADLKQKFPAATVLDCALGDVAGTAAYKFVVNAPPYSGLRERAYDRIDPVVETISVRVVRLDDVIPQNVTVALIKLDIGGEYHAMQKCCMNDHSQV